MLHSEQVFDLHQWNRLMKLVAQIKLLPTREQKDALSGTLASCNSAANWVSRMAWEERCFTNRALRTRVYYQVKERFRLSAQPAQQVIKKVADAYKLDRTARRSFRRGAAQAYDDRCLSWQLQESTVSIWTVCGRMRNVQFTCGQRQRDLLAYRKGESDLLFRDGCWYLLAVCEVPDASIKTPIGVLGVDLGIVNIATTSSAVRHSGRRVNRVRQRNRRLRAKLQAKGTRSAKRLLRKRSRKEARFVTDTNHVISKRIVAEAQRTDCGVVLEDLRGIRRRVRLRAPQRAAVHSWSFHQLGRFISYKARRAGVLVLFVDPAYTSQTCSACRNVDRANRIDQASFTCRRCGFAEHADVNAAKNLAVRGWAAVNQPYAEARLAASELASAASSGPSGPSR
jgi:IS605 OrfB family transposase